MFILRSALQLTNQLPTLAGSSGIKRAVVPIFSIRFRNLSKKFNNGSEHLEMESKEELRARLTPLQYQVTQEAATERPFTGCYNKHYEKGTYHCIVCRQSLFSSDTKYDSGCGWPAFNAIDQAKITLHPDTSIAERIRTEVRCAKCGAHMGHVFDDGPQPTRKRYCINSAAIEFVPNQEHSKKQLNPVNL